MAWAFSPGAVASGTGHKESIAEMDRKETFAHAVKLAGVPSGACGAAEHDRIVSLSHLLAADLKRTSRHYHGHGSLGIFSPT